MQACAGGFKEKEGNKTHCYWVSSGVNLIKQKQGAVRRPGGATVSGTVSEIASESVSEIV
tara:strand:+ start:2126 stop:2305 length:180 start_codon:yes stop_codon:yes gene_type:complete